MKKTTQLLLASTLIGSAILSPFSNSVVAAEQTKKPNDISKTANSSQEAINKLYELGILSGYTDGSFKPKNAITRAEFAVMMTKALGLVDGTKGQKFADSDTSKWHYSVLNTAYKYGLITGEGKDKNGYPIMNPNKEITRMEMMVILVRIDEKYFESDAYMPTEHADIILGVYDDENSIPNWARTTIAKAVSKGITSGVSPTRLGVKEKGNREQSAIFAYRSKVKLDNVKEKKIGEKVMFDFIEKNPDIFTLYHKHGKSEDMVYDWMNIENFTPIFDEFSQTQLINNVSLVNYIGNIYDEESSVFLEQIKKYDANFQKYGYGDEILVQIILESYYRVSKEERIAELVPMLRNEMMKDEEFKQNYELELAKRKTEKEKADFEDIINMHVATTITAELVDAYYDNDMEVAGKIMSISYNDIHNQQVQLYAPADISTILEESIQ